MKSLYQLRTELTVTQGHELPLRGKCLVVPASLQQKVVDIAHEGHQGVAKTKALLRKKVWFPAIDKMVEHAIQECIPCQAITIDNSREPLQMTLLSDGPWQEVSIDFADLPNGEHLLVIVDDYGPFPEVEIVSSTSSRAVLPKIDKVFSAFGIPVLAKTDNGPPSPKSLNASPNT